MARSLVTRRNFLQGVTSLTLVSAGSVAASTRPMVQVMKDPGCGCCGAWIEIMRQSGFEVKPFDADWETLARFKAENGVNQDMVSCHTAIVDDYVIEGHVPPKDVWRLLTERPDAIGLAVPGMPIGSPGMGPESAREAYDVMLMRRDGAADVFTAYDAAT
ncbi:DUF411 domain-containing protein [Shimia abyssi]|uniref:Metal-binding protein n=1 Tax=Shimia abyssi TaxID=1662395 RepID=A0A2P8FJB2_9RHOB|nr:DUF411 domain-containing protein [Shimia abyssi]PSL21807.1 hypothetical protein CLV88_101231 [Shimia abyssi]